VVVARASLQRVGCCRRSARGRGVCFSPSNDLAVDDEDRSDGDAALEHAFARLVATSARRCARQRRRWKVAESLSRDMPLSQALLLVPERAGGTALPHERREQSLYNDCCS
jgi:hypothetical protein